MVTIVVGFLWFCEMAEEWREMRTFYLVLNRMYWVGRKPPGTLEAFHWKACSVANSAIFNHRS